MPSNLYHRLGIFMFGSFNELKLCLQKFVQMSACNINAFNFRTAIEI